MSVEDPVQTSVLWLVVVGAFAAFLYGFGTGSNDVANAFGTSVGAKTLTLRQAVIIAAIFEFTGAMVLGRVSTSVIASGIADVKAFNREPEVLAYGMVCAMTVSGVWQILASYLELNVSSTHSIIGSIIGFALVYGGKDAVIWQKDDPASFPPVKGVVPIIVSWFFSPIFTALASATLFFIVRTVVLRRPNSYQLSFWLLPPFVILTVWICLYFVFTKGAKKSLGSSDDWTDAKAAWISAIVAAGMGVLVAAIMLPILRWRSDKKFNEDGTLKVDEAAVKDAEAGKAAAALELESAASDENAPRDWRKSVTNSFRKVGAALAHGTSVDIHEVVEEDEMVKAIHANAEVFDPKAEYAFQYLQVFSAICVVFSHGAGEVGYMAGPLAAVWSVYTEGKMASSVSAPVWVVFIGAAGLVIGLATYGYNVTRAMGVRLSKLTATRGFCAELSTALVIMIASQYGLPTSSSQCVTGGIIGVGLMEGKLGVNWKFFARQFASWIGTLFISGLFTAALFVQGLSAPSKISGADVTFYEDRVSLIAQTMINNYRTQLVSYKAASEAGVIPRLPVTTLAAWDTALNKTATAAKGVSSASTVDRAVVMSYLTTALSLYQSDSVLTVGQVNVFPGAVQCNSNVTADIQAGVTVACPAPKLLPADTAATWPPKAS